MAPWCIASWLCQIVTPRVRKKRIFSWGTPCVPKLKLILTLANGLKLISKGFREHLMTPQHNNPRLAEHKEGNALSMRLQYGLLAVVFAIACFGYLRHTALIYTPGWLTMIPGDLGDSRFNSVILEHLYQWVTGATPSLWSPGFFYPFERVLAFSDNHFGSGWAYVLFRLLNLPREEAYLGWFLVGSVLNFWACWWALRQLGFSVVGAATGAFVFAFGLPALHKESHAQLIYRFAVPLAFAAWYRFLTLPSATRLAQVILFCGLQFLCSIYMGIFLVYLLSAWLAVYLAARTGAVVSQRLSSSTSPHSTGSTLKAWIKQANRFHDLNKRNIWYVIGACIVLLLTFLMLRRYQLVALDYRFVRPPEELMSMLPRLGSYLLADQSVLTSWLGRQVADVPMRHEQQMFAGLGVWLVAVVGLLSAWFFRSTLTKELGQLTRISSLALLLLVAASLLVKGHSFYLFLAQLPGVGAIRAVSRIALVMLLPMAIIVAAGTDSLIRVWSSFWSGPQTRDQSVQVSLFLLALIGLLTLESLYFQPHHTPMQSWRARRDKLEALITPPPSKGAVLFVTQPKAEPFFMTEIDAMIYAQDHHLATLNGYSGNTPPGYAYPDPCLVPETRINSYFALRGPSDVKKQQILDKLHIVYLEPCIKSSEPASDSQHK